MKTLVFSAALLLAMWPGVGSAAPPESKLPLGKQATMSLIDINQATKSELLNVVSEKVAGQILQEREKSRFLNWPDVVHRVVGLSAAQTAAMASISGLTVDGKSLDGAPPDGAMAAMIKSRPPGQKLMWGAR